MSAPGMTLEQRMSEGLTHFAYGRFDDAFEAVLSVAREASGDPAVWRTLGDIALGGNRPVEAYGAYSRFRQLEDGEDSRLSQLAAAYYAVDLTAARNHAREAASAFPDSANARAWASTMAGIADEQELFVDVGRSLYREGRYDDAVPYLMRAIEIADTAPARLWFGRALLALGDAAGAVPLLESAAPELSDDPTVCVDIAAAYAAGGRRDIARAWLDEGARVHPGSADVREMLARLALDEARVADASSSAETAVTLAPDSPGAWLVAAATREASGDLEGARIAVDRSLALDPNQPDGWSLGARVLQSGDPGLASHYQALAARFGQTQLATRPPGSMEHEVGRLYARISTDPPEVRAYRDRAIVYHWLGLDERSAYYVSAYEQALPEPEAQVTEQPATAAPEQPATQATEQPATAAPEQPATEAAEQPATAAAEHPVAQQDASPPADSGARYCGSCGAEFVDDDVFCISCGARRR